MERYLGDIGDIIGEIAIWRVKYSTSPKGEEETALWLWASSYEYSDGTLMVALLASSVEMTWRGSMDSFYLGQEGSEMSNLWRDQGRPVL
ncbi:hypothetical protein Acr_00g0012220 [Actinidia rufa]|uniref:Uncharacterized protein n=1 Tax=Actinidia rufa TaxID=165716 RepID=A0A7J0DB34_9ERIC|nr:hypothetical protein Acr_00g0012220 [Actinidia rufa]